MNFKNVHSVPFWSMYSAKCTISRTEDTTATSWW
jgi:hypothetical protein